MAEMRLRDQPGVFKYHISSLGSANQSLSCAVTRLDAWRAVFGIVRIGGNHVDQAVFYRLAAVT